jgi:UDP-2,3-diacylglucosamine pyrophosphatase LpxH
MPQLKLAFTSDLHLPITSRAAIAGLAREVAEFEPAALFLCGDIAESLNELSMCLNLIRDHVNAPTYVLAGNHDLWARERSSRAKWESLLAQTVGNADCEWFEAGSWSKHGIAVTGTIAWYDYSAIDPSIHLPAEEIARQKKHFNVDATMIDWSWTDIEFAKQVADRFLATLDRLEADSAVRQIIVATHVPIVECQMCRDSSQGDWAFSNAFFGNLTLGGEVLQRSKVSHIVSGHTHIERRGKALRAQGRPVEAIVIPSDYSNPSWVPLTLTYDA